MSRKIFQIGGLRAARPSGGIVLPNPDFLYHIYPVIKGDLTIDYYFRTATGISSAFFRGKHVPPEDAEYFIRADDNTHGIEFHGKTPYESLQQVMSNHQKGLVKCAGTSSLMLYTEYRGGRLGFPQEVITDPIYYWHGLWLPEAALVEKQKRS